jgi:hypothetical protein
MPHEARRLGELLLVGSTASTGVLAVHDITASGSDPGELLLQTRAQSLGASALSFERATRTAGVVVALAATWMFSSDVALSPALAPVPLDLPGQVRPAAAPRDAAMRAETEGRSLAALFTAIDEEPVEDGVVHHAEAALAAHIAEFGATALVERACGTSKAMRRASLLRLLSRVSRLDAEQRRSVVRRALASNSVEIRDAAVQAAETWEDAALAELLRQHRDPVSWLSEYARRVASDLTS